MATDLGTLKYTLTLDDSGFQGQLSSATGQVKRSGEQMQTTAEETTQKTEKLGSSFSSMAGQFVIGAAVFTVGQKALSTVTGVIKDGIKAAQDWQNTQVEMRSELAKVGGVSGQTADSLIKMAEKTQANTGITRSGALAAETAGLVYTNIGKNIYPAFIKASENIAYVHNNGVIPSADMVTSTVQKLGRAFSDPTKYMGMLARQGIIFTDGQKEQIKTLQKNGDLQGAQALMLQVLNNKYADAGNALKTYQGQYTVIKQKIEEFIGSTLKSLINGLENVGKFLLNHKEVLVMVAGAVGGLAIAIGVALVIALWGVVAPALAAVAALWPIIAIGAALGFVAYEIVTHWKEINKALKPVYEFFDKNIKPILKEIWSIIKEQLIKAWDDLKKGFDNFMKAIKPIEPELKKIAIVLGIALVAPIVLAVAAFALFVAAVVAVGVFVARLIGWISEAIAWFVKFEISIVKAIVHAVEAVVSVGAGIIKWFSDLPGRILGIVAGAATWLWNTGTHIIKGLVDGLVSMAGAVWSGIKSVADGIGHFFAGAGSWLWQTGRAIIQGLINGLENMAGAVEHKISSIANGIKNVAKKILGIFSPSQVFHDIGANVSIGMAQGISSTAEHAVSATGSLATNVIAKATDISANVPTINNNSPSTNNQVHYNFSEGSVVLSTPSAVKEFFNIGNRSLQLELNGGSPLAGTTGV